MKKVAIFPGFFDPFTLGHLDCLMRGSEIFDEIIVAVAESSPKKSVVPAAVRCEMISAACKKLSGITVKSFDGALVNFCKENKVRFLLRGMRNINDFEYERQLDNVYKTQSPDIESVYLITDQKLSHISSSIVKEIVMLGGNAEGYVPKEIIDLVVKYYSRR